MSEIFNLSNSHRQAILYNDQDKKVHQIRQLKAELILNKLKIAESHLNKLYIHNLKTNFTHLITQHDNNKFNPTIETQTKQINLLYAKQLFKNSEFRKSNLLKNTIKCKETLKDYHKIQIFNANNLCQKLMPKTQKETMALKYSGIQIVSSLIQNKLHQLSFVLLFQISKESAKQKQKQKFIQKAMRRLYVGSPISLQGDSQNQKYSQFSSKQSIEYKLNISSQTINSFDIIMKRKHHLNKQKIKETQLN